MPYQATVYNVMIASPSDVENERKLAREALNEWNSLHSEDKNIVLLPIGWDTHTAPEMGAHPQTIIDKQILANADLLIGIFLHRLGTPTLDAQSGTAHEIDSHRDSGKPAMIYFLEEKVDPSLFDKEQYEKLMAFKDDMKKKGLLHECKREEFRANFLKHLTITVNNNEYIQTEKLEITVSNFDDFDDTDEIEISDEAKELLIEASKDTGGFILKLHSLSETTIQTNSKNMVPSQEARIVAKWEFAFNELFEKYFIDERGNSGESFQVTHTGYEYADKLKKDAGMLQDKSSAGTSTSVQQDDDFDFDAKTGTYISKKDNLRYCGKCLKSIPSNEVPLTQKDYGWACDVCGKSYLNPNYNPPKHDPYGNGKRRILP